MTIGEIILSIVVAFLGAKELWSFLKDRGRNIAKIKLSRIEKDENDIKSLQQNLLTVRAELELVKAQNSQLVASFKVILPLLEANAKDDPALKAALEVVKEITIEQRA